MTDRRGLWGEDRGEGSRNTLEKKSSYKRGGSIHIGGEKTCLGA